MSAEGSAESAKEELRAKILARNPFCPYHGASNVQTWANNTSCTCIARPHNAPNRPANPSRD